MKRVWNFVLTMWRPALMLVAVACLLCIVYGFRLGGLTDGVSGTEVQMYQDSKSLGAIWDNPVNAPYKLVVYGLNLVSNRPSVLRLASVGIAMATVLFYYVVSRKLFEPLLALGTTALMATSTVFLQAGRNLSADTMLLGLVFLLWLAFVFRYYRAHQTVWIVGSIVVGLMLYTPPMVIFIIAGAIWQQKRIRHSFEQLKPATIAIATSILFALILPIAISLVVEPGLWRAYLGLPENFASIVNILKSIAYVPVSLFVLSPPDPAHWLGRQPILDAISAAMFLYGLIAIVRNPKLDRLWALLGIFSLGTLWIGLSDKHSNILLLIPFIYLVIGTGLQSLLTQWFDVFPRNPLARWAAPIIMAIAMLFSLNFQVNRYFVAWSHSPDTRAVYTHKISP